MRQVSILSEINLDQLATKLSAKYSYKVTTNECVIVANLPHLSAKKPKAKLLPRKPKLRVDWYMSTNHPSEHTRLNWDQKEKCYVSVQDVFMSAQLNIK